MGFVSNLVNGTGAQEYAELSDSDLRSTSGQQTQIRFVDVKGQDDIVNAKEELHNGNIVVADIAYIESNGLSLQAVAEEMNEAISSVNGDLTHKKGNDIIVATPRDVTINKSKI